MLQYYYPENCDDIFEIMGIYLSCIINKLSERRRIRVIFLISMICPFKFI